MVVAARNCLKVVAYDDEQVSGSSYFLLLLLHTCVIWLCAAGEIKSLKLIL